MKKETKNPKMVFKDYYNSLTQDQRRDLRDQLLSEAGIGYSTFYYKMNDTSRFSQLEQKLVIEIVGQNLIF